MNKIVLTFYINNKLDQHRNIKATNLYMDEEYDSNYDAENPNELMDSYGSTYKTDNIYSTLNEIINKLSIISSNSEDISKNSNKLPSTCFSRCMVVLNGVELEERKINFTNNPHAQHIHIFNRDGKGMIRIKEQKLKDLLDRTIDILKTIKDEI